jgi:hypothetical protein
MQAFIAKAAADQQDDCCLMAALTDWTLCNLYAGCRGVEWMQTDSTNLHITTYHKNRFGNAYAFTLQDVQCASATNQSLLLKDALANPDNVGCIRLRFEEQKNGENGEKSYSSAIPKAQQCVLLRTSCAYWHVMPKSQNPIKKSL